MENNGDNSSTMIDRCHLSYIECQFRRLISLLPFCYVTSCYVTRFSTALSSHPFPPSDLQTPVFKGAAHDSNPVLLTDTSSLPTPWQTPHCVRKRLWAGKAKRFIFRCIWRQTKFFFSSFRVFTTSGSHSRTSTLRPHTHTHSLSHSLAVFLGSDLIDSLSAVDILPRGGQTAQLIS